MKQELLQHEIVVEEPRRRHHGDRGLGTQKIGLDKLLEAITLQAEILDLKANPNRAAEGTVIEAGWIAAAARSPRCWSRRAR